MNVSSWPLDIGGISFWYSQLGLPQLRPPLAGDVTADICIVGAGYTGLWAAYYLKKAAPELRILIVEAEFAGFGASGRNGGWLTGGFAWNHDRYRSTGSDSDIRTMVRALNGTVDEIISISDSSGIDANIRRTDELMVATNPAQHARMLHEIARRNYWGESHIHEIGASETVARLAIPNALGAMVVPGVARIQPAKLVQGLARLVERLGVQIAEKTRVTSIAPGQVTTNRGMVKARTILRATEGYTSLLSGHERDWLPLNSAQIATAPLPEAMWSKIGWQGFEIVGDFANSYCYCQRSDDDRIIVGGRGIPYRFGNRLDENGAPDTETIQRLIAILHRHFPVTSSHPIDHAWCGVLAVPRDWCASVSFDPATRIGYAGGYVGVGVSTSNLAGRTLADLALGRDSELTRLPWINRPLRRWEPEPFRWLGLRGMYALLNAADRAEDRGANPSRLATLGNSIMGR